MEKACLLIIDDQEQNIQLLQAIMHNVNLKVFSALNGLTGIQMAHELNPELIILDHRMPGLEGLEVLETLRREGLGSVIIFITAYGNEEVAAEAFRKGANDYIKRPFSNKQFLNIIEGALMRDSLLREKEDLIEQLILVNAKLSQLIAKSTHRHSDPNSIHIVTVDVPVFFSYARSDWDTFVKPAVEHIQASGIEVWIDQHLLEGGHNWLDEIGKALGECQYMVLFVTPTALQSRYVRMEYRYFLNENKLLIPYMCNPTQLPPELNGIQYISHPNLNDLTRRLRNITGK